MTTVKINLPDHQAAALEVRATAQGLTLEEYLYRKLANEDALAETLQSPKEAVARILELQERVKPDPEGWTVHDYINYGRL